MYDVKLMKDSQLRALIAEKGPDTPQGKQAQAELDLRARKRDFFKRDLPAWFALIISTGSMLVSYFNWHDNQKIKNDNQRIMETQRNYIQTPNTCSKP